MSDSLSVNASAASRPDRRRATGVAADDTAAARGRNYGDAGFMDEQLRITDLVPRRLSVFLLLFVLGVGCIASLEGLYSWMPRFSSMTQDGSVATFDLDDEGSLAVWFSSMILALSGVVAILVFTVRRHRKDDYSGRYRVWLWAAMCCLLMSVDETASLHEGFKGLMCHLTGTPIFGDGSVWWVVSYGFLLGAIGTRLIVDMRECRLSTTALVVGAGSYALAVAAQLGWVLPQSGARGVMLEEGAEMLGNLCLLLGMGLHARHVILDAEGRLPQQKNRRLRADDREPAQGSETDEASEETSRDTTDDLDHLVKVHPPHGVPRSTAATARKRRLALIEEQDEAGEEDEAENESPDPKVPVGARSAHTTDEESPDSGLPDNTAKPPSLPVKRKLTKAERKALRRRLKKLQAQQSRQENLR